MASSSSARQYEVFLSFRGEDTRKQFVSHLFSGFESQAILTFKDDRELQTGDSLSNELPKAIGESKFAVVVISQNYGSSRWCLDELQMIMERHKEGMLNVIPIFYGVDPSDVRKQRENFAEAFEKHEVTEKPEKVEKWRAALVEVANLTGVDSRTWQDEATMVGKIVTDISDCLLRMTPKDTSGIFGMDAHLEALTPLLSMESGDEVRMIGIWGMGGIGKTTIASFLFDDLKRGFRYHCFMSNVKKISSENGLEYLQRQFLSKILSAENLKYQSFEIDSNTIKVKLCGKKVLAILDDIDDLEQLQALAKDSGWFGPGSRIIVTTRDKGLLISHNIKLVYEVECLGDDVALNLFNHFAFGERHSPDRFKNLSISASKLVQGVPLALKVLGSYLHEREKEDWETAICRLKGDPRRIVMGSLKVSYYGLDEQDKCFFLGVACLFNGQRYSHVAQLLDDEENDVSHSLKMLAEKSLIHISEDGRVNVHDLIQEMAREIVNQQSPSNPGGRRYLWDAKEIYNVLEDGLGTDAIEGISLNMSEMPKCPARNGAFENMRNLKFLKIHGGLNCKNDLSQIHAAFNHLPRRLRLLDWPFCPLTILPYGFHAECLVDLCLPHSELEKLSEGTLFLGNLRRMDLQWCSKLKEISSLCGAKKLEELDLSGCDSLVEVPSSFTSFEKLTRLSMRYCLSLKSFPELFESSVELYLDGTKKRKAPDSIQNLSALEIMYLSHCKMLSEIPSTIGKLTALIDLDLSNCENLRNLPDTIGCLIALETLTLKNCSMLAEIPSTIGNLITLSNLNLSGCENVRNLPDTVGCLIALETLILEDCRMLAEIPSTIGNLITLSDLNLSGCKNLRNLPDTIGCLIALETLTLKKCSMLAEIPSTIGNLITLNYLNLSGCENLRNLPDTIGCLIALETLTLKKCSMLAEIPSTIGNLITLNYLNLSGCENLRNLPDTIGCLIALESLTLEDCSMLAEIPSTIGNLITLNHLNLSGCENLRNLPDTIGCLIALEHLILKKCSMLAEIPSTIGNLITLDYLNLYRCENLRNLPDTIGCLIALEALILKKCSMLAEIPSTIGNLITLRGLNLSGCENLRNLPDTIGCLIALENLTLEDCSMLVEIPSTIGNLITLNDLNLSGCENLRNLPDTIGNLTNLKSLLYQKTSFASGKF